MSQGWAYYAAAVNRRSSSSYITISRVSTATNLVPTNEPSQVIYPGHTLNQIHFPLSILSMPQIAAKKIVHNGAHMSIHTYTIYNTTLIINQHKDIHRIVGRVSQLNTFYHEQRSISIYKHRNENGYKNILG